MERVHPDFMRNRCAKAMEKGDMDAMMSGLSDGLQYWTDVLNKEIGPVSMLEAPLIIAALRETADAYAKVIPDAGKAAEEIRRNMSSRHVVLAKWNG